MKKRTVALVLLLSLLITIPVYAASPRIVRISPNLSFSGNQAICSVSILGENGNDTISATMTLMRGSQVIAFWRGNGTGSADVYGTAAVERGVTYTLTVDVLINGVWQTPYTISRTNN